VRLDRIAIVLRKASVGESNARPVEALARHMTAARAGARSLSRVNGQMFALKQALPKRCQRQDLVIACSRPPDSMRFQAATTSAERRCVDEGLSVFAAACSRPTDI
jgi:hypothetical protein